MDIRVANLFHYFLCVLQGATSVGQATCVLGSNRWMASTNRTTLWSTIYRFLRFFPDVESLVGASLTLWSAHTCLMKVRLPGFSCDKGALVVL